MVSEKQILVAKPSNFSLAFEQMCNFVAIANVNTNDRKAIIETLVQQCFLLQNGTLFQNVGDFVEALEKSLGIEIATTEIEQAVKSLESKTTLLRQNGTFHLSLSARSMLAEQVKSAGELEQVVKDEWLSEVQNHSNLHPEKAWNALQSFLSGVFRRHGVQAVSLLDPSVKHTLEHDQSLRSLLDQAASRYFDKDCSETCKGTIINFLQGIGKNKNRVTYISQLADATYNYFSLAVPPEVSESFRRKLESLTLFLDTNFLFNLLDLNINSKVVAEQLVLAVNSNNLPFKLRYHQETDTELRETIRIQAERLINKNWLSSLSRAAVNSGKLMGIELRYHQKNSETKIDVASFLKPYEHPDILLKDKKIEIYRTDQDKEQDVKEIKYAYQAYLDKIEKDKPVENIRHDAVLLATAHRLRSDVKSSLAAGALVITLDYTLYRFDWEISREKGIYPCTVLPESFLQIIRPYLPSKHDYDAVFAQAFSFLEFRTVSGNATEAASRVLAIMAGYQDFPEETASRILSNSLFLEKINGNMRDDEIREELKIAIELDHAVLVEENVNLQKEIERKEIERQEVIERSERELAEKAARIEALEASERTLHQKAQDASKKTELLEHSYAEKLNETAREAQTNLILVQGEKESLQEKLSSKEQQLSERERAVAIKEQENRKLKEGANISWALFLATILIVVFELAVYRTPIPLLNIIKNHENTWALQGSVDLLILFAVLGFFVPRWRAWAWTAGVIGIILIIVSLLGGPSSVQPSP